VLVLRDFDHKPPQCIRRLCQADTRATNATMTDSIQFETPENIQIAYQQAGLGTRFLAWFTDMLLLFLMGVGVFLLLICGGLIAEQTIQDLLQPLEDMAGGGGGADDEAGPAVFSWALGMFILLMGLGSFFYFGMSELLLRGQTIGKRMSKIRVVKADGFALDGVGILVRNIFRVVDQIPVMWIVPLLSARGQRFGDMVSGTLVVQDQVEELAGVRERLSARKAADALFRFDAGLLKKLQPSDFESVERILERWPEVSLQQRDQLLDTIIPALTTRLDMEPPGLHDRQRFLEELLAAEYRRQNRELG